MILAQGAHGLAGLYKSSAHSHTASGCGGGTTQQEPEAPSLSPSRTQDRERKGQQLSFSPASASLPGTIYCIDAQSHPSC